MDLDRGTERRLQQILRLVKKMDSVEVVGLMELLGVKFYEEEFELSKEEIVRRTKAEIEGHRQEGFEPLLTPRNTNDIIGDFVEQFCKKTATRQKEILKICKAATKK